MGKSRGFLRLLVPSATAFFSGASLVILEMVASRLLAQDLGSSLYTWTAIVGVVLAGIAVGAFLGGRIADRHHARRALAVLFGLSSAACVGIIIVDNVVGEWMWLWRLNWPTHVFVHVVLALLVPSTLLGTIGPVLAKSALAQGLETGRTVGRLCAWAAAGGIVGVFLAGYYLIVTFGTITIIWAIGAAMLAMAVLYWISCWAMYLWAMLFGALATMGMAPVAWAQDAGATVRLRERPDPSVLYEAETRYCHVAVRQTAKRPDRRAFWQDQSVSGQILIDDVTNLQRFYARMCAAMVHHVAADKSDPAILVIGAGGYALPQYVRAKWPQSRVDVVEVDPGVTKAAREAFGLDDSDGIRTIHTDARHYVNLLAKQSDEGASGPYDLIFVGAIRDDAVPFQLVTREFDERIPRLLTDHGIYMVNVMDISDGGRFVAGVFTTLREVFEHVYITTRPTDPPSSPRTFAVIASSRALDLSSILHAYNRHQKFGVLDDSEIASILKKGGGLVLTDDLAPAENLAAPVVCQGAQVRRAHTHFHRAVRLQRQEQFEQSIAEYEQVALLDPSMAIDAYSTIAAIRLAQGDLARAEEALHRTIECHERTGSPEPAIVSVHHRLGVMLKHAGRMQESREHLREAVKWARIELESNPNSVVVWERLGETLAILGDLEEASKALERAVSLEPGNPSHYEKLAEALELQGRYGEAIEVVRRHLELVEERAEPDRVAGLQQQIELLEYRRAKERPR